MKQYEMESLADKYGFARIAFCTTEPFARWLAAKPDAHRSAQGLCAAPLEIAPWAKVLMIAAAPYPLFKPCGEVSVSAYYVCYNAVHRQTVEFVEAINALGVRAQALEVPIKPAARRARLGEYGRNGLIQLPGLGSCVMIRCIALGEEFDAPDVQVRPADESDEDEFAACGKCHMCEDACPVGAIRQGRIDTKRCLRAHMMQGPAVPEEFRAKMGGRLLGCEECLRACPKNASAVKNALDVPVGLARLLDIGRVLRPAERSEYVREYGELLGYNYANPNRILSQAMLCAANLGMREFLDDIVALESSNSPAVREHAAWAAEKLL